MKDRDHKAVLFSELVSFTHKWEQAGGDVVQQWDQWAARAADFFGIEDVDADDIHGVLRILKTICHGAIGQIHGALRDASPGALELCHWLTLHLQPCYMVVEAEKRFRGGELEKDWELEYDGAGRCVVRTQYRKRMEH